MTDATPLSGLYSNPALAQFYDLDNAWGADFDFCMELAREAHSVLDLGCGTGELTVALAEGRAVTGVDPAAAMLEIARRRPRGQAIQWVEADARSLRLGRRFDLVLLTGHAFQFFLTPADQAAAIATIAAHLSPAGRFVFDTRNPNVRQREQRDGGAGTVRRLAHPELGEIEAWSEPSFGEATGILASTNFYRIASTGETLSAPLQIRFTSQDRLATMLKAAGLTVEKWLGDWHGGPYHPSSNEIIPIGRLA